MDLFEEVREVVCEQLNMAAEEITLETSLIDDLGVDSLDTIDLVLALEEKYGMEIPDEDAVKMNTVGDVVEYIKKKIKS